MKNMKTLAASTLMATILFMTACQKDVVPQQSNISKEKLTGTYKVTAMKLKGTNGTEEDLYATLPDCQKQSRQTLNANLSYQLEDACDATNNQTATWQFVSAQQLIINGVACTVASFDGTRLVLSFDNFLGIPGTLIETLTRQ